MIPVVRPPNVNVPLFGNWVQHGKRTGEHAPDLQALSRERFLALK